MRSLRGKTTAIALAVGLAAATGTLVQGGSPAFSASAFGSAVVIPGTGGPAGIHAGEPGINAAPNDPTGNTIYVNAPAGFLSNLPGSPSYVWRSTDGGANWTLTPPSLRANFPGGGDSNVAIDGLGHLFMTDLWLGSATVSSSADQGNTWTANPVQGVIVQDRQWIATTGGNVVYHVTHQIPTGIIVSKSIDGGLTFPINSLAASALDQTGCICPPGYLVAQAGAAGGLIPGMNDLVGVAYATTTGGIKFAGSTNGGLTFTNTTIGGNTSATFNSAFPVVATTGVGQGLVATWLEIAGNTSTIWFSSSTNWGASWGAPKQLVGTGGNVYPWIAAKGTKISVTLYHAPTTTATTPDTAPTGTPWFESYLESADGGANWSTLSTVDPTSVKSGPICTQGTGCSANRELLDFQTVTIDPTGRANATWTRSIDNQSNTEIRFARQVSP